MKTVLARRIEALEQRKSSGSRVVHFIKATDHADSDRQVAELVASGVVGPRDGFLSSTGWTASH